MSKNEKQPFNPEEYFKYLYALLETFLRSLVRQKLVTDIQENDQTHPLESYTLQRLRTILASLSIEDIPIKHTPGTNPESEETPVIVDESIIRWHKGNIEQYTCRAISDNLTIQKAITAYLDQLSLKHTRDSKSLIKPYFVKPQIIDSDESYIRSKGIILENVRNLDYRYWEKTAILLLSFDVSGDINMMNVSLTFRPSYLVSSDNETADDEIVIFKEVTRQAVLFGDGDQMTLQCLDLLAALLADELEELL